MDKIQVLLEVNDVYSAVSDKATTEYKDGWHEACDRIYNNILVKEDEEDGNQNRTCPGQ